MSHDYFTPLCSPFALHSRSIRAPSALHSALHYALHSVLHSRSIRAPFCSPFEHHFARHSALHSSTILRTILRSILRTRVNTCHPFITPSYYTISDSFVHGCSFFFIFHFLNKGRKHTIHSLRKLIASLSHVMAITVLEHRNESLFFHTILLSIWLSILPPFALHYALHSSTICAPVLTLATLSLPLSLPIILYYLRFIRSQFFILFYLSFLKQRKKTYYPFFAHAYRKLSARLVHVTAIHITFSSFLLIFEHHSRTICPPV